MSRATEEAAATESSASRSESVPTRRAHARGVAIDAILRESRSSIATCFQCSCSSSGGMRRRPAVLPETFAGAPASSGR